MSTCRSEMRASVSSTPIAASAWAPSKRPRMPLIKGGRFVEDPFVNLPDDAEASSSPVIVSLARFQAERAALLARGEPFGVRLKSGESPEALKDDIAKIAVVA